MGWSDVGILMPYRLWKQYGDTEILHSSYESMKKYARFMMKRVGRNYLTAQKTGLSKTDRKKIVNAGQSFGEWAEPADVHKTDWIRDMKDGLFRWILKIANGHVIRGIFRGSPPRSLRQNGSRPK